MKEEWTLLKCVFEETRQKGVNWVDRLINEEVMKRIGEKKGNVRYD